MMKLTLLLLAAIMELIPYGETFLKPLQKRDSILVADQLEYGFQIDSIQAGTVLALPDFSRFSGDTLTLVRGWKLDTLKARRRQPWHSVRASVVIAPFEEGTYHLPDIPVLRRVDGKEDTLVFAASEMEVKTMPVDTATFVPHDLKGQIGYPLTARDILPWLLCGLGLAALIAAILLWRERRKTRERQAEAEPAHIVALRRLEHFRGEKYWAPDKQKIFYSGVTDALKAYIEARYEVDAPEMTTAELFSALERTGDLDRDLCAELRQLFERADFVKFAKYLASDEENAAVLPLSVRFVTATYQSALEEEQQQRHEL